MAFAAFTALMLQIFYDRKISLFDLPEKIRLLFVVQLFIIVQDMLLSIFLQFTICILIIHFPFDTSCRPVPSSFLYVRLAMV